MTLKIFSFFHFHLQVADVGVMNEARSIIIVCVSTNFAFNLMLFLKFFTPVRHFIWTRSMWSYPCHNHCRSYIVSLCYVNLNSKHSHIESDNQKTIEVKKMPTWNHPIISIKMQNNCQCTSSKNYSEVCFILDGFTFISKENVQLFKVSHFSRYKYTFIP